MNSEIPDYVWDAIERLDVMFAKFDSFRVLGLQGDWHAVRDFLTGQSAVENTDIPEATQP